jgi:hypothetical protein
VIIARVLAVIAVAAAGAAWVVFSRAGLVLSHYDAKAHLVVARRIIDNITPGWQQIGAVWLPLPHILQALPTQIDLFYESGASGSFVSIVCFGVTTYAAARLVLLATPSQRGAAVAAALIIANPNLLYLHTTPMAEPLLLATTTLAVLWLCEWVPLNQNHVPLRLGLALFAAAWTRYEAWLVLAAAIPAALYASSRIGASRAALLRRAWNLCVWPGAAVGLFLINSRITVGAWFVASGFFVPDPHYSGQIDRSLLAVWWGTHQLSTRATEIVAIIGALVLTVRALAARADAALLVSLALFAPAALPAYAFYQGHPFRIRYMIPVVVACAIFSGVAVGSVRRQAVAILGAFLVGITLLQSPPWRRDAPLLVESTWDVAASADRRKVSLCLASEYRGEKILASMGSLAHFMQELAHQDIDIADFVHEGNGVIWELAMETGPRPHAGWMLVEEQAEGGDILAQRIARDPQFADGMERVCEGGGVTLYKRAR